MFTMKAAPMKNHMLFGPLGALLLGPVFVSPASAQTAPQPAEATPQTDDAQLGDIIVTAQKRSQSLTNVGLSITAADGAQLARLGLKDKVDLDNVPTRLTLPKNRRKRGSAR